jgi:hypothetical protein
MKLIRRPGRALLAAAVVFCFCAAARAEGVLDQVPADAWVVFRVNKLEQTNKKVAAWAEAMGLAQMSPEMADPLGAAEREMKIQGLDRTKDLAICLMNPDAAGGNPEKSILILLPTTDFKATAASLPNSKTEGELTTFNGGEGEGDKGFAAKWGDYAAITPTQAILSKKRGGLKLAGLAAKEMQQKDAVIYANIPAMKATLLPQLQKARQQVKQQMQKEFGGDAGASATPRATTPANPPATERPQPRPAPRQGTRPQGRLGGDSADVELTAYQQQPARPQPARRPAQPARPAAPATDAGTDTDDKGNPGANDPAAAMKQYAPAFGAMVDQYFAFLERVLNEGQSATFSLNLTDEGLNTTLAAEFSPGSYLGKIASGFKNTDAALLKGLPGDRKYFAFGGFSNSPEPMSQLVSDFLDPVIKQLAGTGQGGQNVTQLVEAVKKSIQNTKSSAMGYPAATGALGTESIIQSVAVTTGNAKAIGESQKTILKGMNSIFQNMPHGNAAAAGAQPQVSMQFQEGAKAVGGVKLDQYKMDMQIGEADSPQAAQAQQMMAMIYGPNGMSGVMGAVNDNTYIVVQGGTDQLIQSVIDNAKNPQDKLSSTGPVKAAGAQLPQNRFGVFYVQLDQIITSGVKYAQGFGMPVKMQLPQNLPPLGFSAASDGPAMRFDMHLPTTTVQSIVAAGMQAYMQMQGGGAAQPGAPEGL